MKSPATAPDAESRTNSPSRVWSRRGRLLASAALLFHLTAVILGPLSFPPAIVADALRTVWGPYLQAAFLDHGYKFFAPDPGPSHLIRYEIEFTNGSTRRGTFPNLVEHWPRLLYHRHFMLSEQLAGGPPDREARADLPWEEQPPTRWQKDFARSYARHLLHERQAKRVTLYLVEHLLATPEDVARGMRLDDPASYRQRELGSFQYQEEFPNEARPVTSAWDFQVQAGQGRGERG